MTSTVFPSSNKFASETGGLSPIWSNLFRYLHRITGGYLSQTFLSGNTLTTSNDTFEVSSLGDVYIAGVRFPKTYEEGKVLYVSSETEFSYGTTNEIPGFFFTGEVAWTPSSTPANGWILLNGGSIGSSVSAATNRANDDTEALFELLWTICPDSYCPVSNGRGLSAAADFTLNKTLTLPNCPGRAFGGQGIGSGLTARLIGETTGSETHTLTTTEMPRHSHTGYSRTGTTNTNYREIVSLGGGVAYTTLGLTVTSGSAGNDSSHPNMQPTVFLNTQIKL
jgi:microcystin-dependent protein